MKRAISDPSWVDPVCSMRVTPETAAAWSDCCGTRVYFCAQACKRAFEANPEKYQRVKSKPKGIWGRYLERLNKTTGGRPPSCCG